MDKSALYQHPAENYNDAKEEALLQSCRLQNITMSPAQPWCSIKLSMIIASRFICVSSYHVIFTHGPGATTASFGSGLLWNNSSKMSLFPKSPHQSVTTWFFYVSRSHELKLKQHIWGMLTLCRQQSSCFHLDILKTQSSTEDKSPVFIQDVDKKNHYQNLKAIMTKTNLRNPSPTCIYIISIS